MSGITWENKAIWNELVNKKQAEVWKIITNVYNIRA